MLVIDSFSSDHLPKLHLFLDFNALCIEMQLQCIKYVIVHTLPSDFAKYFSICSTTLNTYQGLLQDSFKVTWLEIKANGFILSYD